MVSGTRGRAFESRIARHPKLKGEGTTNDLHPLWTQKALFGLIVHWPSSQPEAPASLLPFPWNRQGSYPNPHLMYSSPPRKSRVQYSTSYSCRWPMTISGSYRKKSCNTQPFLNSKRKDMCRNQTLTRPLEKWPRYHYLNHAWSVGNTPKSQDVWWATIRIPCWRQLKFPVLRTIR